MTKIDQLEFRYNFSKTLRRLRAELDIKQQALAETAGVTQACLSQWGNAARLPSLFEFTHVCKCLKTTPDAFLKEVMKGIQ